MRRQIIVTAVLCIFSAWNLPGYCGSELNPKDVLVKYLDATFTDDSKTLYECISEKAKEGQTLEEFMAKKTKEHSELEKAFTDNVSYEIKDIIVDGDMAKAVVLMTVPDFAKMFSEAVAENIGLGFKDTLEGRKTAEEAAKEMTGEAIMQNVIERFKDKDVPLTTADMTIEMIKEKGAWKICYKEQALRLGKKKEKKVQE